MIGYFLPLYVFYPHLVPGVIDNNLISIKIRRLDKAAFDMSFHPSEFKEKT